MVALVGVWFFRFNPYGDVWRSADEVGINPWWAVALLLLGVVVWLAFRIGLLEAG